MSNLAYSVVGSHSSEQKQINEFGLRSELLKLFVTSDQERAEIISNGFSIGSSVKDVIRVYFEKLLHQEILQNSATLNKFEDKLPRLDQILFSAYSNKILSLIQKHNTLPKLLNQYDVIEYFKKQLLSQLGEKSMQRYFRYEVKVNDMPNLIISAYRSYQQKPFERERIELINLIHQSWSFLSEELKERLRQDRYLPEIMLLEPQLCDFSKIVRQGNVIIEVSPPIYQHQTEVMIRFGRFLDSAFQFEQFALPNRNVAQIQSLLSENQIQTTQEAPSLDQNKILGTMFIANSTMIDDLKLKVL